MDRLKVEIKWAFIFIAMTLLWMLLERLAGLHSTYIDKHMYFSNLYAIPAIAVYVFALREKKRKLGGTMTYKQGTISGLIITAIVAIFSPLTQWIVSTLITPEYFSNIIAYSVSSGLYQTPEAAAAYFNLQNYIVQNAVSTVVMGIITTLVVALFVKSKNNNMKAA